MNSMIPDYYPFFHCKIGQCRTPCCDGWPVTFSMKDYFKLLGVECSPELRSKLDISLHLTSRPTEEEYAMILPRYDGRCPVRHSDGRCALQMEAGEEALPDVCRQYPRSIRPGECCCANSCEAVIELLDREEPIRFITQNRDQHVPEKQRTYFFETGGREMDIRLWLIGFVQDRQYTLGERLARMSVALRRLDEALRVHDAEGVDRLLSGQLTIETPHLKGRYEDGIAVVKQLLERLDDLSYSIRSYGEAALAHFEKEGTLAAEVVQQRLRQASPHWDSWGENMIVNHMFFSQFPFQDRPVSLVDETIALNAVYGLLRFLAIGAGDGTRERMVDIAAALFRLVDHTAFDRYAIPILEQVGGSEKLLLV